MDAEGSGAGDAQQPLVSPARAGRSQSFATAATGAVAFILGSLLYVALVATEGVFGDHWLVFRAVVLSPQLIAWVVIVVLVGLLAALTRVRSALTGLVVLTVTAATGALWWWRDDALQQQVLVGVGLLLLVGAWRHLATMLGGIEARR